MNIGDGDTKYSWIDDWADIPDSESARNGWSHHGIVVTRDSEVISYHAGDATMLVFDLEGNFLRSWDVEFADAHGITLVEDGGTEYLWIADNGRKRKPEFGYDYPAGGGRVVGQVVKMALDGNIVMRLEQPNLPIYESGDYMPTCISVDEERHGGSGDVWVTDGYGQSYIHRYNSSGEYQSSINGEEGDAGAFNCPHGIWIDRRKSVPELYVADRTNSRIQVYDLEGNFKRVFGSDFLTSPSAFAVDGERMVVAELRARLAILDIHDNLVAYLGDNETVCEAEGWPNNKNQQGEVVASQLLEQGKFNSPHGIATDADGNIYVAEWLIGGRFTKLARI